MAEVTEIVTVFKFEGDVKPIKDTGDAIQDVSENSAVAGKRVAGASESITGLGSAATAGLASMAALAAGITKVTQAILGLGKQTAELKGLGIDPVEFRETEDLFSKLGAADGDAANFVKKITEAQNQMSLGLDAPFARSLQEQFGVLVGEGDNAADVLSRLREATEKQGFTAGQISVKAGELGFSPEFSKVLLATNSQFAEATEAIKNLAQSDRTLLEQSEAVTQSWKDLDHATKRLWERFSLGLSPVLDVVINVLDMVVDGWSRIFNLSEDFLLPIFTEMWTFLDKNVIPIFEKIVDVLVEDFIEALLAVPGIFDKISDFLSDVFLGSFNAIVKAFDFFVDLFRKHVIPVIKLVIDVFFDIVDAIRKAIDKIPFVGGDSEFKPIQRPTFGQGLSSTSNSSSVSNNQSTTNINIDGLSASQIDAIIRKAQSKQSSMAAGSW